MRCIRWANLDAMWAQETEGKNLREACHRVSLGLLLGLMSPFPAIGPYPVSDTFGMSTAAVMLLQSLDAGVHDKSVQFLTTQKIPSTFSNVYQASVQGYTSSIMMAKDTKKLMVMDCPTNGAWYECFM